MLIHFDSRRTLAILPESAFIPFVAERFYDLFEESVLKKGYFTVALSGGSTPKELYAYIANHPKAMSAPWGKLNLFWGDERAVPQEHPDSNYHMAMAFFKDLPIPSQQVFRMVAETDIEANARHYEEVLQKITQDQGLDLVFLGMGDDGHTASLFPHTEALKEERRLVVANHIPEKKCDRMTLTFPCINNSKHCIFLVKGSSKASMINQIFSEEGSILPSFHVGTDENKAFWVLDEAAALELLIRLKKGELC